jgi:hypothetical protein
MKVPMELAEENVLETLDSFLVPTLVHTM